MRMTIFCGVVGFVLLTACASAPDGTSSDPTYGFQPSSMCRGCHTTIYEQHSESMHVASYTNPVFQAQFTQEYLPQFHKEIGEFSGEPPCLACHAPMTYVQSGYDEAKRTSQVFTDGKACERCHISGGEPTEKARAITESGLDPHEISTIWRLTYVNREARDLASSGVGCDLCHTITGWAGESVGDGRFLSSPGPTKYGPFKHEDEWHHAYGELQTKSEFCAICHEASNRNGVPIRSTYSEWKASPQAQAGVQCQDCHMTVNGFLGEDGTAEYESGVAAHMTVGREYQRDTLYTHRFVGAASHSQIEGAVTLDIQAHDGPARPGSELEVVVVVNNSRTGHRFPTGSPELRSVRLALRASVNGVALETRVVDDEFSYGVLGANDFDFEIFGNNLPGGVRIYRAVLIDEEGLETLSFYNAAERVFDNRLAAAEIREERFVVQLPASTSAIVDLEAEASYLRYPQSFARRLEQREIAPVTIATAAASLEIGS